METVEQRPIRQRVRRAILLLSLLLFPLTLYYFSPALILQGASEGIINGSFLVFALMLLSALFLGRAWCGWACPAGALQEVAAPVNDKLFPGGKADWIKWAIWIPWVGLIVLLAVQAGGYHSVDPFYQLEGGLTLLQPFWFIVYYSILALFLVLALIFGRRASCHTICWMAPFMIIGRRLRGLLRLPALQIEVDAEQCVGCQKCDRACPMSLEVHTMVQRGSMENDECILCGTCVDVCPQHVKHFSFSQQPQPTGDPVAHSDHVEPDRQ